MNSLEIPSRQNLCSGLKIHSVEQGRSSFQKFGELNETHKEISRTVELVDRPRIWQRIRLLPPYNNSNCYVNYCSAEIALHVLWYFCLYYLDAGNRKGARVYCRVLTHSQLLRRNAFRWPTHTAVFSRIYCPPNTIWLDVITEDSLVEVTL